MTAKQLKRVFLLFLGFSFLQLLGVGFGYALLVPFTKPLLMPLLALYWWGASQGMNERLRRLMTAGLLLAAVGDTLLLFAEQTSFFLGGMGAFFLMQLCYIAAFLELSRGQQGLLARRPYVVLLLLAFYGLLMWELWSGLGGGMRLPVMVYGLAIMGMAAAAIHLYGILDHRSFRLLVGGALWFIVSDSLLALNRFTPEKMDYEAIPFIVMFTYLLAQTLIVVALIHWKQVERSGG